MTVTVVNIFNTSVGKIATLESPSGNKVKMGMKFANETSEFSITGISLFGEAIIDAERNLFNCVIFLSKGTIDVGDIFKTENT